MHAARRSWPVGYRRMVCLVTAAVLLMAGAGCRLDRGGSTGALASAGASGGPVGARPVVPVFTSGTLGTSTYTDPTYRAVVTAVRATDYGLAVSIDAQGNADLRYPTSSCLKVSDGSQTRTVVPYASHFTVDQPGHDVGTLVFPLILPGQYGFQYACLPGYTTVPLGSNRMTLIGLSVQGDYSLVAVLGLRTDGAGLTVWFGASGFTDSVAAGNSCLYAGARTVAAHVTLSVNTHQSDAGALLLGTMTFPGVQGGQFQYSCRPDYSSVELH